MIKRELHTKFLMKFAAVSMIACAVWASEAWSATSMKASKKASQPQVARKSTLGLGSKTSIKSVAKAPAKNPFKGSINVSPARTLVDFQDGSKAESNDTTFENTYQINESFKAKSKIIYSQNLKNSAQNDFADIDLSVSKSSIPLGPTLTLSPTLLGTVPLSKNSRLNNQLNGALGVGLKWGLASGTLIEGLSLSLTTALSRLFHQATTSISGSVLNQYTAYQKLVANYSISKYSFTLVFNHTNSMTYQNNLKEGFVFAQEFEFTANDSLAFQLGHANAGSALKANAQDSNIQFFNENTSVAYVGVTWSYL